MRAKEKYCFRCKKTKPLTDFSKDRSRKDGYAYRCRACTKAHNAKYYQENREEYKIRHAEYRTEHCTERKAYIAEYSRSPRGKAIHTAAHNNRRVALDGISLTGRIVEELIVESNGICPYCKEPITEGTGHVDHIIPVSGGGTNNRSNLVYVCADCNQRKHNKSLLSFIMESRQCLNQPALL